MLKKLTITTISLFLLAFSAYAGSNNELTLSKNQPEKIKDCFEKLNRVTFGFNQALDGVIFQPVASLYRKLPSPAKTAIFSFIIKSNYLTFFLSQ